MMNAEGVFIGQVCHIEAAEPGGERFNAMMTNEQRRHAKNLMLMCYEHHKVTDNTSKFTVKKLQRMKQQHEARFVDPARAIRATLQDWTTVTEPTPPKNAQQLARVLGWTNSDDELVGTAESLADYIEKLRVVPVECRNFIGKIAARVHLLASKDSEAGVFTGKGVLIACRDVEQAFRRSRREVAEFCDQLRSHKLGRLDEMDMGDRVVSAVLIADHDGWNVWESLATFAAAEGVGIETFTEDLDFSALDA